jgi:hypothetical protein
VELETVFRQCKLPFLNPILCTLTKKTRWDVFPEGRACLVQSGVSYQAGGYTKACSQNDRKNHAVLTSIYENPAGLNLPGKNPLNPKQRFLPFVPNQIQFVRLLKTAFAPFLGE